MSAHGDPWSAARHGAAIVGGSALLALVDGAVRAIVGPHSATLGLDLATSVFDASETIGLGAVAAATVAVFVALLHPRRWAGIVAGAAAVGPVLQLPIGDHVRGLAAATFDGRYEGALDVAYSVLAGFLIPAAVLLGRAASRRQGLRIGAVFLATAAIVTDQAVQRDGYFGVHGVWACVAAMFGGAALAPWTERWILAAARRRSGAGALCLFAALGVAVPPPNAVRVEIFRQPATVAPWVLATLLWRLPRLHEPVRAPSSPWLTDRAAQPPVPPTTPRVLPDAPVVVLVSIDAVRADAAYDPAHDALFPALARMRRQGVVFTRATAAATQTALSIATVFTSRYASQLAWSPEGAGPRRYSFPSRDPSPRFPQILTEHGVATFHEASIRFLGEEFGVVRGFSEHPVALGGWGQARASTVMGPLIERIVRAGPEPLFAYAHMTEPHAPYDRGRRDGSDVDRYLSEIAIADAYLAKVLDALAPLGDRWVLMVTADHGEAFGEHGTFHHGETLYQELLHVPLLVMGPRIAPRVVDQRVSLVDLGPTVLDLFGVETPGTFMGQSLAPLLVGAQAELTRPLISEGKLRRSLTTADGLQVMEDPRRELVEAYDVERDPGETRNLFDVEPARVDPVLATLRAFVVAQTRGGEYRQDGEF